MKQDNLRKLTKIAKAKNDDIYFKDFAAYLEITEHSFYNWLNREYSLSKEKEAKLYDVVVDLAEQQIKSNKKLKKLDNVGKIKSSFLEVIQKLQKLTK